MLPRLKNIGYRNKAVAKNNNTSNKVTVFHLLLRLISGIFNKGLHDN
jgi:hypothetical protein